MKTIPNARLADAIAHLGTADEVFVRLALSRDDQGHTIFRSLIIDVLPQSWLRTSYNPLVLPWLDDQRLFESRDALFYCGLLKSDMVQRWFREPGDCGLTGFDDEPGQSTRRIGFALPELHESVSAWHLQSYAQMGLKPIPFPSTLYTVTPKSSGFVQFRDDEPLVDSDGNYFPSFRMARAELIFGVTNRNQAYQRQDMIAIRAVDARGWLKEIRVSPDKALVTLGGMSILRGSYVAVEGDGLHDKAPVVNHHVEVPLPATLPQEIQVVLLGGHEVLDTAYFYGIRHPYAAMGMPYAGNSPQVIVEREDVVGYLPPIAVEAHISATEGTTSQDEPDQARPKVFISYSHDSAAHKKKVLELANRLCREGVDCHIDRYVPAPTEGWPRWMQKQIEWADFVLVVCTDVYARRFTGQETPGTGLGAAWEGQMITQQLYDQAGDNDKFIPIIFAPADVSHIPMSLRPTTRYNLADDAQYDDLYGRITDQPLVVRPMLGTVRKLTPREG